MSGYSSSEQSVVILRKTGCAEITQIWKVINDLGEYGLDELPMQLRQ